MDFLRRFLVVVVVAYLSGSAFAAAEEIQATKVVTLGVGNFTSVVVGLNRLWIVEFRKGNKGWSGDLPGVAMVLKGVTLVGSMDCKQSEAAKLARSHSVKTFPSLVFFGANVPGTPELIEAKNKKDVQEYMLRKLPNLVHQISDSDTYLAFRQMRVGRSQNTKEVLLFTEKRNTTILYKALALYYKGVINFGEVRGYEHLMEWFHITSHPTLLVIREGEVHNKAVYEGPLQLDLLLRFLQPFVDGPESRGAEEEQTAQRPRPGEEDASFEERPKAEDPPRLPFTGKIRSVGGYRFDMVALTRQQMEELTGKPV